MSLVGKNMVLGWAYGSHGKQIYIDYNMAFFISCPLSALGLDITARTERLKG